MNQQIFDIALACRLACQDVAETKQLGFSYFIIDGLGGLCAMASEFVFIKLRQAGFSPKFIKCEIAYGPSHCWNYCDDTVIDITATQFDNCVPPVYTQQTINKRINDAFYNNHDLKYACNFDVCNDRAAIRNSLRGWHDKLNDSILTWLEDAYSKYL